MAKIPSTINSVTVEFSRKVVNDVDLSLVKGLMHCIKGNIAKGYILRKIYISSANDQHTMPSRHSQKKAVDISRINGVKMAIGYPTNPEIKAIVEAIQTTFETYKGRRENFGPHLKLKLGRPHTVSGHKDHIHISVN